MSSELVQAMAGMDEPQALALALADLEGGRDPLAVLADCRLAVEEVGRRFEAGKYFLPELIMAGEMLQGISRLAEPFIQQTTVGGGQKLGKVVIGSVAGDIHDIGKDMVSFILDVNGFEIIDLGVDVAPARFVAAVEEHRPVAVGMSALLSTVLESVKDTVAAIDQAGLREGLKIMVGGSAVDEGVRKFAGADGYGKDAVTAVGLVKGWL